FPPTRATSVWVTSRSSGAESPSSRASTSNRWRRLASTNSCSSWRRSRSWAGPVLRCDRLPSRSGEPPTGKSERGIGGPGARSRRQLFGGLDEAALFEDGDVYRVAYDEERAAKSLVRVAIIGAGGVAQARH